MTNEQAIQEAIKKAYGDKFERFSYAISTNNGFIDRSEYSIYPEDLGLTKDQIEENCEYWRPASLIGLADNNGWIRVEPDGSNLPSKRGTIKLLTKGKHYTEIEFYDNPDALSVWKRLEFTHYKEVKPEKPPVY